MLVSLEWQLKLDKKRGYTLIAFLDDFLQHHSFPRANHIKAAEEPVIKPNATMDALTRRAKPHP